MKNLIGVTLGSLLCSTSAFAHIYCVVPYSFPDTFKPIQKFVIEKDESKYVVTWPTDSVCSQASKESIECEMDVKNKTYTAKVDLKLAASPEYQVAGEIRTGGFFFRSNKEIYCLTEESSGSLKDLVP